MCNAQSHSNRKWPGSWSTWKICALTSQRLIGGDTDRKILKRIVKIATASRGKLENLGKKTNAPSAAARSDTLRWFSFFFLPWWYLRNVFFITHTNRGDSFVARPCNVPSARIPVKSKANVVRCVTLSDDAMAYVMTGRLSWRVWTVSCFICFICILSYEKCVRRSSDFLLNKKKSRKVQQAIKVITIEISRLPYCAVICCNFLICGNTSCIY